MLELSKSGKSIDVTTVLAQLTAFNVLEQSGGIDYISEIADYSYSPRNVETYVELIENASLRRNTINTLSMLAQNGYDSTQATLYRRGGIYNKRYKRPDRGEGR